VTEISFPQTLLKPNDDGKTEAIYERGPYKGGQFWGFSVHKSFNSIPLKVGGDSNFTSLY